MEEKYIYGLHPVKEALFSDTEISKVFISQTADFGRLQEVIQQTKARNIALTKVPVVKLDKLVKENHQGIVAQVSPVKYWDLEVLISKLLREKDNPILIYLDGVTDTRNLGGIARSAGCLNADGIIIPNQGSANVTQDTIKTSAGAILKTPVARIANSKLAMHTLLAEGFSLFAITEKGGKSIYEQNFDGPTCLIFGGEAQGVSKPILKLANEVLQIPMEGGVSSLNVSVAVGITCYELLRQRAEK